MALKTHCPDGTPCDKFDPDLGVENDGCTGRCLHANKRRKKYKDNTVLVRGKRFEQNQSDRNRVRVHPWVPVRYRDAFLELAKALCNHKAPIDTVIKVMKDATLKIEKN